MRELNAADVPELQRLFEDNAAYFEAVNGTPPRPDEAAREFADRPPPDLPFGHHAMHGFEDGDRRLKAVASVLGDFIVPTVWHLGLFIVATDLHGTGAARRLYERVERQAIGAGAAWLRLGVVSSNRRAARFWEQVGYREVRQRHGYPSGTLTHTVRVMVKPLAGGTLDEYLGRMARDRPE